VLPGDVDLLQVGSAALLTQILGLLLEELGETDDGVQWGPQLMRHVRQELALVLADLLQLAALGVDLVEQRDVFDRDRRLVSEDFEQLDLQADARARGKNDPESAGRTVASPPDQVSWLGLSTLIEHDPESGWATWVRIKSEARAELGSGHRAAMAFQWDDSPWERARFLAIRQAFIEEWQPRGGIESTLIDQMAQAHTAYLFWMTRAHVLTVTEGKQEDDKLKRDGYWQPPRVDTAAALDQAAAMADRFHRLFLRTLRALRRYTPPLVVQNVEQLNVGGQQVNVSQAGSGS